MVLRQGRHTFARSLLWISPSLGLRHSERAPLRSTFEVNNMNMRLISLAGLTLTAAFAWAQDGTENKETIKTTYVVTARPYTMGMIVKDIEASDKTGRVIRIPDNFRGKIVLVDMWHPPTMRDAWYKNLAKLHDKYKVQGLEVVHLYTPSTVEVVASIFPRPESHVYWNPANTYTWIEACECKDMNSVVVVPGPTVTLPQALLIDGDTGEIIATDERLWGTGLERSVDMAMKAKYGAQAGCTDFAWYKPNGWVRW